MKDKKAKYLIACFIALSSGMIASCSDDHPFDSSANSDSSSATSDSSSSSQSSAESSTSQQSSAESSDSQQSSAESSSESQDNVVIVDSLTLEETERYLKLSVEASADKITVNLTSDVKDVGDADVEIFKLKPYQYFDYEKENDYFFTGVSEELVGFDSEYKLFDCKLGKSNSFTLARFEDDGYDNLYSKYYVVRNDKIIKDGVFATKIDDIVDEKPVISDKSKKGLFGEDFEAYKDLNCSNTALNFDLNGTIYPNEIVNDDGTITKGAVPSSDVAYSFESNGKTFYFNKSRIDEFEKQTRKYYELGARISVIVLSTPTSNDESYPIKMTYYPYATQGAVLMGQNTSNKWGFEYYVACLEFLNYRHTMNNFENGYIANYVLNNEVDFSKDYFRINGEDKPLLETYAEEVYRLTRLANLAAKKYYNGTTVAVPFTHNWGKSEQTYGYAPLDLVEWFNKRSKTQGDFDWAIAPHCYGNSLIQVNIYKNDTCPGSGKGSKLFGISGFPTTTNDHEATSQITFSNLEVLDLYLNQDYLKCAGKVRSVYLTEAGISSFEAAGYDKTSQRNAQAACIALSYYKVSQLDSIVAYSYYRAVDHAAETVNGVYLGLIDEGGIQKPSYELWKYIDTQYSSKIADKYLKDICYWDINNTLHDKGSVSSYSEALNLFGSDYDFSNFDWGKATPEAAKCDTVLELEDKVDLGDVKFEDADYLYDGEEHALTYSGTLNSGIDVEYENNTMKDCGTKKATAIFKKDGEVVGKREATITVRHVISNKKTYKVGEKIFVTTSKCDSNLILGSGSNSSWVAIYKADATIGSDSSQYWYYDNISQDTYLRTKCIQEGDDNLCGGLPIGRYKIVYFKDSGYNFDPNDVIYIQIVGKDVETESVDLSNVSFKDKKVKYEQTKVELTIEGTLPEGITVEYKNNSLNSTGETNAVAIFKKDGVEIERRYAVLTVSTEIPNLSTNKSAYVVGEDILFTAYGKEGYWVGIYLKDDKTGPESETGTSVSIYWLYVVGDNHVSGGTYEIKSQYNNLSKRPDYKDLPAGEYKIVLFDDTGDGYHVAETVYITIVDKA